MNRLIYALKNGIKIQVPSTISNQIIVQSRQFCTATVVSTTTTTTSNNINTDLSSFKSKFNNSQPPLKSTININAANNAKLEASNSLQKAILLMNIKELFKKNIKIAIDLLSKHLKLKTFKEQDVEVLFQWVSNNRYFTNIDSINLFLIQFIGSNNLSKIQKLIQICQSQNIAMSLTTYEILIRYFTISKMKPNLKSTIESLNKTDHQQTEKTHQDLVGAYIVLEDIEKALFYYKLIKKTHHLPSYLSIIRYYQNNNQMKEALEILKDDISSHRSSTFLYSGSFLSILNNFPIEMVENVIKFLLKENLTDDIGIQTIIEMHLEKNVKSSSHLLHRFSDFIQQPHLYIKLSKQVIQSNDFDQLILILDQVEKKDFSLNIPTYQYILESAFENNNVNQIIIEKIINHIISLNTQGNEMSTLLFYSQMKDKYRIFEMLVSNLEKQSINYIDQITTQMIRNFIQVGHYDLALSWFSERFQKYGLGINVKIVTSFIQHPDEYLRKHWLEQIKHIPDFNREYSKDEFRVDQVMVFIESFLKEQQHLKYYNNNSSNNNNSFKKVTTNTNLLNEISEENLDDLTNDIYESNQINDIKETNLQLQKLLQEKLIQTEQSNQNISSSSGKYGVGSTEWIPKEFSKGFRYILSEMDSSLSLAIETDDYEKIFSIIKDNLANNMMPQGALLISAYYKLYECNQNMYMELLQETPYFLRTLVFNYKFYVNLLYEYPDAALYLLQQESPLYYTENIYNQILEVFVKAGRIDVFMPLVNLMITTNISIHTNTLREITKTMFEQGYQTGNSTFLINFIKHLEQKLKNLDNSNANINNNSGSSITSKDGTSSISIQSENDVSKNLTYAYSLLLNELLVRGMHDELFQFFQLISKNNNSNGSNNYLNYYTVAIVMKSMATQYTVPPVSNITNWLSIIKYCQGVSKSYFYQSLFHQLYLADQSDVIVKFIRKDPSIIDFFNLELYESILKYAPNDSKLNIQLLEKLCHNNYFTYYTTTQEIIDVYLNSIDFEFNELSQSRYSTSQSSIAYKEHLTKLQYRVKNLRPSKPKQNFTLSNDSVNSISHFVPIIIEQYQKKNPNFDPSTLSNENTKQLPNEYQKIEIAQYIKLKGLNIGDF